MTSRQLWIICVVQMLLFVMVAVAANNLMLTMPFDVAVLEFVHGYASSAADIVMVAMTGGGGAAFVASATLVMITGLMYAGRKRQALQAAVIVGGSAVATIVVKLFVERVRPELWTRLVTEDSFSFPSGHATASMALGLTIVLLSWHTRWRWVAVTISGLYVAMIALTRLYLGVHYPTDIIGGWL
ncbi:MAG: phosphatase PAP2 family protein, partial [Candidatus Saccharimonadales bacterium]